MKKNGSKNGTSNGSELAIQQIKEVLQEMSDRIARAQEETARQLARTDQQIARTDKQIAQTNEQVGALSNKWGSFTEGLAFPSMARLLDEHFGMTATVLRARKKQNGSALEVDVLGYNDESACVVEIKSHLRKDGVKQILNTLSKFPKFFSEHGDKRLYGMIAAVDFPEGMKEREKKAGLYLARVQNETFEVEELFPLTRAKDFNPATKGQRRNGHR